MGLNAIHRIRDMKKQISLILKKGIEMTQEKTGRECSQKKVYPVYVISLVLK
jgi:hypothetical protein